MASTNPLLAQIDLAESLGVVDDYLRNLYSFKEDNDHQFFANLISGFIDDTVMRFTRIEIILNSILVDFFHLSKLALLIVGSAGSVGAFPLKMACHNLSLAANDRSKDRCFQAFNDAKREYAALKPHFDAIIQVEEDIFIKANGLHG